MVRYLYKFVNNIFFRIVVFLSTFHEYSQVNEHFLLDFEHILKNYSKEH